MAEGFNKYKRSFMHDVIEGSALSFKRPLMGCKDWNGKADYSHIKLEHMDIVGQDKLPLKNLLDSPSFVTKGGLLRACHYLYAASTKYFYKYPSMQGIKRSALTNESILEAIELTIDSRRREAKENFDEEKVNVELKKQAANILQDMQATITSKCLRFCGWLFLTLLRKLCSSVTLHQGQLNVLRKVLKENGPVILLPLHCSHFDYILLSTLMFDCEMRAPFVASGNNLALPIFSYVMKRVGGFFIRRKIDTGKEKDILYRAVLHAYISELLKREQVLEVFIEGTRTRSGFPTRPKTGILSIVVDSVDSGTVRDATLVPVSISFEKLIDGHFHSEMMGADKRPETFLGAIRTTCKIFLGYYGHIRVNFGVPRSLKKTLTDLRSSPLLSLSQLAEQIDLPKAPSNADLITSQSEKFSGSVFSHSSVTASRKNVNRLTNCLLAEHLVYRSLQTKVFMSTNVLSFLLIHRYRSGVSLPVLVVAFEELVKELLDRKWDVGFSGDCYNVVIHALTLFGPDLVQTTYEDNNNNHKAKNKEIPCELGQSCHESVSAKVNGKKVVSKLSTSGEGDFVKAEKLVNLNKSQSRNGPDDLLLASSNSTAVDNNRYMTVIPNVKFPYIFELAYYGNALAHVYALESLAALTVGAVLNCRFSDIELEFIAGSGQSINYVTPAQSINSHQLPPSMLKEFSKNDLIVRTLELTDLLRFDLILCDVTEELELCVFEAIDRLLAQNCLLGNGRHVRKRRTNNDDIDDNDETETNQLLHVNFGAIHDFIAKQSILGAFVEGYVVAATELPTLLHGPMCEKLFKSNVLQAAHDRNNKGSATRIECASSEIVRHAIHSFEMNGVVLRCGEDNRSLKLSEQFSTVEAVAQYVSYISQYLM